MYKYCEWWIYIFGCSKFYLWQIFKWHVTKGKKNDKKLISPHKYFNKSIKLKHIRQVGKNTFTILQLNTYLIFKIISK